MKIMHIHNTYEMSTIDITIKEDYSLIYSSKITQILLIMLGICVYDKYI